MTRATLRRTSDKTPHRWRTYKGGRILVAPIPAGVNNIHFDNPSDIEAKLNDDGFFERFLYGLGSFLSSKEELANKRLKNLNDELAKLDDDFNKSIENYKSVLGESSEDEKSMRGALEEKVQEMLSQGYQTKYNEMISKKQAYKMVIQYIQNRRAYIVYDLQSQTPGSSIKNSIIERAKTIYSLYRGDKYKDIRMKVFDLLNTLAYSSPSLKSSFQLNLVITGPAGSGKTTIARELSKWYSEIGLFTFDSFNENPDIAFSESGRTNFIAEYTGQTAPKTLGVLYQNLEKTLFMDEAYSIAGCNFDKTTGKLESDAYGEEFVSELLRFMNDHKGMCAIIVAGYKNLMNKCFMERNEGLPRRFPTAIDLPLSSTDELFNIFLKLVVEKSYEGATQFKNSLESEKKKLESEKKLKDDAGELAELDVKITAKTADIGNYKQRIEATKMQKIKFYCIMKPTFMMIHMDTSFPAIELLRKYLLMIKLRLTYEDDEQDVQFENVYSYTITTQVLMCLLETQLQRNLLRRHFYAELFNLEDTNLSFFKAQAGEMGLIADLCTKTIGAAAALRDAAGVGGQKTVTIREEMGLMDTYFYDKGIEVKLYEERVAAAPADVVYSELNFEYNEKARRRAFFNEEVEARARLEQLQAQEVARAKAQAREQARREMGSARNSEDFAAAANAVASPRAAAPAAAPAAKKYYMEVVKRGKELAQFQEKINSFLRLEDLFQNLPSAITASMNLRAVSPLPSTPPKKSAEKTRDEIELERKKQDATNSLADLFIEKKLEKIAAEAGDPLAYFDEAKGIIEGLSLPSRAGEVSRGVKGNSQSLPSLSKLFELLHTKESRDELIRHMVNIYFQKNTPRYINALLDKVPTDFPIHLERVELEFESKEMQNPSVHYTRILKNSINYNTTNLPLSLQNPKYSQLTTLAPNTLQYKTLKADISWEDIGIF